MRVHHVLLMAVFVILVCNYSVLGSTTRLRSPKSPINSPDPADAFINGQRMLREDTTPQGTIDRDDEERGAVADMRNKLGNKMSVWLTNRKIATAEKAEQKALMAAEKAADKAYIAAEKAKNLKNMKFAKEQVRLKNLDAAAENLFNAGITPEYLHVWFRLDKTKNQWMSKSPSSPLYYVPTPQYQLWEKLTETTQRLSSTKHSV
ncbi:hypothetical protein AM587_10002093 [Phytophthora nicotianae]|uniref:RxLR effector protein n=1 Tax=Phytophthora nicotianae TaxID=4792 RepID=A0A0W8DX96_PHYNI|nr:hypothetical protein AM587_10002093 [Phytophthora nicotianae]